MDRILSLEYKLSHPYPKGRWFLSATILIFSLVLPVLILVNLATLGSEQVLSLQTKFQPNETLLAGWWGTERLPSQFHPRAPECQLKDIGRGDNFRLTSSLFEYTVMSLITNPRRLGGQVSQQARMEYRGQNFSGCYANSAHFTFNPYDATQSVMVTIICPDFPHPPAILSMQTTMTFAWELNKDFVGQYYGPGTDLQSVNNSSLSDYREIILAVLEVISADALTIMARQHLSSPIASIRVSFEVNATTGAWKDNGSRVVYMNGTVPEGYTEELQIYTPSIANLMTVAMDSVHLDLGSNRFPNIFRNATYMRKGIRPNFAPENINSTNWAEGTRTFYYGTIPAPYQTWADAFRHGYPVKVGDLPGLPEESTMYTTYLCPSYQVKPMGSLISSVFVGSATMFYSAWGAWMFLTGFLARRIVEPRVECLCDECRQRREEERREAEETPRNRPVSGMVARFMSMGHRRYTNETNDEEQDHVEPKSPEPKGRSDSLAADYLSYTKESTTKEK